MRIEPLAPDTLNPELRAVHDEIVRLVGNSQSQVKMMDANGALAGPFPAMLMYPRFGIPALSFIRTLDMHATLDKRIREVAILTVGAAFHARFELYAHEIMAAAFGLPAGMIATLAAGGFPQGLNKAEHIAHTVARALVSGHIVPDSLYKHAVSVFGQDAVAELFFLVGSYSLIAMLLNGFDVPAP